jgi:hypothetical protein
MPYDRCPGKLPEGPRALLILKNPSVLSADGLAPILLRSPPTRFSRMTPFHLVLSAFVHEAIPFGAYLLGHPGAEGVAPAPAHTGFIALIRATVGEPTGVCQRPLRFHFICGREVWLGLSSSV